MIHQQQYVVVLCADHHSLRLDLGVSLLAAHARSHFGRVFLSRSGLWNFCCIALFRGVISWEAELTVMSFLIRAHPGETGIGLNVSCQPIIVQSATGLCRATYASAHI